MIQSIRGRGLLGVLAAATTIASACGPPPPALPVPAVADAEVRALWVVRYTLADPDSVRTMVRRAHEAGFNTLIVQVRGRGDSFYSPRWEPRADTLAGQPAGFDPLELVIREARPRGLAVHAWVNAYLNVNVEALPGAPEHLFHARPDLLAVPRPLARELYALDPREPGYREKLIEFTRENRDVVEGLYLAQSSPEVKEHVYSIWMDLLERYDVDGIHYDYVRYPAPLYDYSRVALDRFRQGFAPNLPPEERARFDALAARDPLVYADSFPDAWDRFRRAQVTDLVERIYHGVQKRRPGLLVTAAVFANAEDAYENRYQEWREWLRRGILDIAAPMAYTTEPEVFRDQIRTAVETAGGQRIWAGIGSYRLPVERTVENIRAARELGTAGIVLFSYDSAVRASPEYPEGDYLLRVRDRAFLPPAGRR